MKRSEFRSWCHQLWIRNCDERNEFGLNYLPEKYYVREYRWWLKREFRHQKKRKQS